jgi:hypothetical protein
MTLTPIGRDGLADFTIGGNSVKCLLNLFDVESNARLADDSTFCIEGQVVEDVIAEQLTITIAGILKQGVGAYNSPFIPVPRNTAVVATYTTGNYISCTCNFVRASARRANNDVATLSATLRSTGAFTVTWVNN